MADTHKVELHREPLEVVGGVLGVQAELREGRGKGGRGVGTSGGEGEPRNRNTQTRGELSNDNCGSPGLPTLPWQLTGGDNFLEGGYAHLLGDVGGQDAGPAAVAHEFQHEVVPIRQQPLRRRYGDRSVRGGCNRDGRRWQEGWAEPPALRSSGLRVGRGIIPPLLSQICSDPWGQEGEGIIKPDCSPRFRIATQDKRSCCLGGRGGLGIPFASNGVPRRETSMKQTNIKTMRLMKG